MPGLYSSLPKVTTTNGENYFLNRLIIALRNMVIVKLTIAPTAAKIAVFKTSALLILAKMVSNVPPAVPALVDASKYWFIIRPPQPFG